mgnify:CR=1 FL=1
MPEVPPGPVRRDPDVEAALRAAVVADVAWTVGGRPRVHGVLPLVALGLCAGLAQSLAKFCLDATIQSDVPTKVQASAFARSDTTLQLAWVVGGFVGIALPLDPPRLGLGVAFAVLAAWMFFVLAGRSRRYPGEVPVTG